MSREVRFGLTTLGLATAMILLGYFPTQQLAGVDSTLSMVAGVAVGLAASWAGAVPVMLTRDRVGAFGPGNLVLAAMLVRLAVVLALSLAIALSGKVDRGVFLIWVAAGYMVLLAADTHYAVTASIGTRKEHR
jgi:phosphoglycerol transferase MdoB-like AlkP superfamily enzyme